MATQPDAGAALSPTASQDAAGGVAAASMARLAPPGVLSPSLTNALRDLVAQHGLDAVYSTVQAAITGQLALDALPPVLRGLLDYLPLRAVTSTGRSSSLDLPPAQIPPRPDSHDPGEQHSAQARKLHALLRDARQAQALCRRLHVLDHASRAALPALLDHVVAEDPGVATAAESVRAALREVAATVLPVARAAQAEPSPAVKEDPAVAEEAPQTVQLVASTPPASSWDPHAGTRIQAASQARDMCMPVPTLQPPLLSQPSRGMDVAPRPPLAASLPAPRNLPELAVPRGPTAAALARRLADPDFNWTGTAGGGWGQLGVTEALEDVPDLDLDLWASSLERRVEASGGLGAHVGLGQSSSAHMDGPANNPAPLAGQAPLSYPAMDQALEARQLLQLNCAPHPAGPGQGCPEVAGATATRGQLLAEVMEACGLTGSPNSARACWEEPWPRPARSRPPDIAATDSQVTVVQLAVMNSGAEGASCADVLATLRRWRALSSTGAGAQSGLGAGEQPPDATEQSMAQVMAALERAERAGGLVRIDAGGLARQPRWLVPLGPPEAGERPAGARTQLRSDWHAVRVRQTTEHGMGGVTQQHVLPLSKGPVG